MLEIEPFSDCFSLFPKFLIVSSILLSKAYFRRRAVLRSGMMICGWTPLTSQNRVEMRVVHPVFIFLFIWPHQVWGPITVQDSESEGSTRLCLDCFDLRPRHQIIYNWKQGGHLFLFSTLIWKKTPALYGQSLLDRVTSEGVYPNTIISLSIVCVSSTISNYKWYTTINFIRNWTFNLFLPNVWFSQANLYSLMARHSFCEKLRFDSAWRSNFNCIVPVFCLHVQFLGLIFLWITNQIFHLSLIVRVILLFHAKNNCYLFDKFLFLFLRF